MRRLGKSYAHPLMVLVALPNQTGKTRIGVAAGKAVGNAVMRNRAKRLIRAAAALSYDQIFPGWDLILIARAPLADTDLHHARPALNALLLRAKLLRTQNRPGLPPGRIP